MSAATTGAASGDSVAPADIVMPVKLKFAQILVCWSKVLAISGVQFRPCVVGGRGLRSSSGRACSSRVLTYAGGGGGGGGGISVFFGFPFLSFFLSFLSWDRPGGGRRSCRGPPADCERSRRTVNRKDCT